MSRKFVCIYSFLLIALAVINIFTPTPTYALVVSDPGAYSRFAQQIKELQSQIKKMEDINKSVLKLNDSMTGSRGYGSTTQSEINRLRSKLEGYTSSLLNIDIEGVGGINSRKITDVQGYLDTIFDEKRTKKGFGTVDAPLKEAARSKATKAAIERAMVEIAEARDTYDKLDIISREIDTTGDLKDAQDLTNKLLSQLILVQQKGVELLAYSIQANQLQNFKGEKKAPKRKPKPYWKVLKERADAAEEAGKNFKSKPTKYCRGKAKELGLCGKY